MLLRLGMLLGICLPVVTTVGCGRNTDDIVRVSRQNNSGTYHYFREVVLNDGEFKLGSFDQSGSKDVVELVSTTRNAIGYSGMGYATDDVKMLKVSNEPGGEAVAPTSENAAQGSYPLARKLYIYTLGEPMGPMKHYLSWVRSAKGQAIVDEIGYVPVPAVDMQDDTNPGQATIKVIGSDTMVNLAQAWAEQYGKKYPQVDVQVSGGGSGVGIAKLIDGTADLATSSRDMKEEEKEMASENAGGIPVQEYTVALDALAIYVHKGNPLESISLQEMAEIYGEGGTITSWTQVEGWSE